MTQHSEPKSPEKTAVNPVKQLSTLARWLESMNRRFWRKLAQAAEDAPGARATGTRLVRLVRVMVLAALSFTVNEVPVRSAALVFTTLLAFIPLAIILSSVAGFMGYLNLLQELIPSLMGSLNLDLPIDFIIEGLERADSVGFHQLGIFGTCGLLIGFYLSMSNIEEAMNRVWNVRQHRGWLGRVIRYTPFLLLLLVLMVASVFLLFRAHQYLDTFLQDVGGYGSMAVSLTMSIPGSALLFGSLGAVIFMWMLMVLMIRVLPNTRVRFSHAVLGATAGVVPLYLLSRGLLLFPALFIGRNQLFYGSLAIVPVALLLIYVFWACTLFGCAVAFVQHRLGKDAGGSFFTRGTGFMEDWNNAVEEVETIYRRPSRPAPPSPLESGVAILPDPGSEKIGESNKAENS
jgi:YihY family inner membrane protein